MFSPKCEDSPHTLWSDSPCCSGNASQHTRQTSGRHPRLSQESGSTVYATGQSDRCRWPPSFQTLEATVTDQLVDDLDCELPQVSLASVARNFSSMTNALKSAHTKHLRSFRTCHFVCVARRVKSTHLVV